MITKKKGLQFSGGHYWLECATMWLEQFHPIQVQSSSKDDDTLAESSCNNENSVYENNNKMTYRPIISSSIPLKSFVILKVYSHAKKFKNFIAQIISGPDIDGDYEIKF